MRCKKPEINSFLDDSCITHFLNREPISLMKKEFYLDNDVSVVFNTKKDEAMRSYMWSELSKLDIELDYLREPMIANSIDGNGGYPTTGILSIVHSVVMGEATDVTIIGVDFYDSNYFSDRAGRNGDSTVLPYQTEKGKTMKSFLKKFIENNPQVNFTIITDSSERWNLRNLKYK